MARPPRLKDFSYIGRYNYFLTVCTHERKPWFNDENNVEIVRGHILRTATERGVAIHAYCFMPDHLHVLGEGLEDATDLRAFVINVKQYTGWQFKCVRRERLWQAGYYDHVVRPEEGTATFLAYIVNNPVAAGLVAAPLDYPLWGSATRSREEIVGLIEGVVEWRPPAPHSRTNGGP